MKLSGTDGNRVLKKAGEGERREQHTPGAAAAQQDLGGSGVCRDDQHQLLVPKSHRFQNPGLNFEKISNPRVGKGKPRGVRSEA